MEVLKITQVYNKLSVKNDYVFKRLFTKKGNEKYLKEFLSNLLKMDIQEIKIEHDKRLDQNLKNEKYGVLDVKAVLNDDMEIDIELQIENEHNIIERSTFYGTRLISSQLESGQDYLNIKPSIVISILNFNVFEYEEYINSTVTVLDKHREREVNKYLKYYYIELPKFRKRKIDEKDKVSDWLAFIDSKDEKRIGEVMERNEKVKKANEELEYLSGDAAERSKAELREKYKKDITSAREHGIRIGEEKGIEKGMEKGIEQGEKNKCLEIAREMLKEGLEPSLISKITSLSSSELEKLL